MSSILSPEVQRLKLDPEGNRERSRSTSDFDTLRIMETGRETGSPSPPAPLGVVKESRSHSLTPQAMRKVSHYATLGRPLMRRGKTIDTSSIRKEVHEVCSGDI